MTKGYSNKPLLDEIVCKNYFRKFSHDTAKKSVLFKLLNLITGVIPEYIMGRILYRYQIFGNKLAPFMGGILPLFPWKAASPRNVEYGWIIKNLKRLKKSQKIKRLLDVGCSGSYLCYELLHQGFEVYGLDIEQFPFKKTTFKFYACDISKTPFPDKYFDVIVAISTLEHVGLGTYGDPAYPDGDLVALREIARILSSKGFLLITVPYSHVYSVTWQRIYDWKALEKLIDGLFIIYKTDFFTVYGDFYASNKDFFVGGKRWLSTTMEEANRASKNRRRSVACLVLKKHINLSEKSK